ncbi:MAG: endo alpha-1,4 polygalactosaminidase [Myxococcota bacterium]
MRLCMTLCVLAGLVGCVDVDDDDPDDRLDTETDTDDTDTDDTDTDDTDTDTDAPPKSTTLLADVQTYATYYGRDPSDLAALDQVDLAIVQPLLTMDQLAVARTRARVVVYLSIGEIGLSNTYLVDGEIVLGQSILESNPEWFLGKNPNFDAHFADTNQEGWRTFVRTQANQLMALGYDGLFLDTVDTVDVFPDTKPGMIALIEALRADHEGYPLVQNRGIEIIPETGPSVDALMFEVFTTRYDSAGGSYVLVDQDAPGYAGLVEKAVAYRAAGGVVLAQDFGDATTTDLACQAQARALDFAFIPSMSDAFFGALPPAYPSSCPWPNTPTSGLDAQPAIAHLRAGETATFDISHVGSGGWDEEFWITAEQAGPGLSVATPGPTVKIGVPGQVSVTNDAASPGRFELQLMAEAPVRERLYRPPVVVHEESLIWTNAGISKIVMVDEPATWQQPGRIDRRSEAVLEQPYDVTWLDDGRVVVAENVGDPDADQPAGALAILAPFELDGEIQRIEEGLNYPTSVRTHADGTVWIVNSALDFTGTPRGEPNIASWTSGETTAKPMITFAGGTSPTLGFARSVAFDGSDRVWVSTSFGLIVAFEGPFDGSAPSPVSVLAGAANGLFDTVFDLEFDGDGDLWMSGSMTGQARIVEIAAGSWTTDGLTTNLASSAAKTILTEGLHAPWGLGFDSEGGLWVINRTDALDTASSRGSAVRFDPTSLKTGATPDRIIGLESRSAIGLGIAAP